MDYRLMVQRRADLVAEADKLVTDGKAAGTYPLEGDAAARYIAIKTEVNSLSQAIKAEDEHRDMLLGIASPLSQPSTPAPAANITGIRDRALDDPTRGFRSMADFGLAVKNSFSPSGAFDPRLRYTAAPTSFSRESGDDSGAGYQVPPQFEQQIMDLVSNIEMDVDVMSLIGPKPTSVNAVQLLVDETTVWSGNGIIAGWRSEGIQMNPTKLITKARSVQLWEAYVFVLATQELLADVAGLNDRLTQESAEAFRWLVSEAFVNGDGVGKPLGFLNAAALTSVAKESSQTAATIVAANVTKMYARLINYNRAFWIANRTTFPQLMTMSLANINTGVVSLYTPPAGAPAPNGGMLMGLPVYLTEHCQVLGTKGDIQLVSPSGYIARIRSSDPEFATSIHLYFDYNVQAFRWTFRVGGEPALSAAVAPAHGSDDLSHFVSLDTRS